jgi:hypothetical protein
MAVVNAEALAERVRNLGTLNGIRLILVTVPAGGVPDQAQLEVRFHNSNGLAGIVAAIAGTPALSRTIFPVRGGHRRRAGSATGQVQVTAVAATGTPEVLTLTVAPIGDYSTYTLGAQDPVFDTLPALSEVPFKFRPGCFSTECAPCPAPRLPAPLNPRIDYLAKDFDSFRHVLLTAMMQRVPGWTPTSEADFDQTLLELFAVAGDELSDFQDRVMNEAYLGTARKRVSLARHARLMDYHIHQGNQSSTWLVVEVTNGRDGTLPAGFTTWSGIERNDSGAQLFLTRQSARVHYLLNRMELYTWSGAQPALEAGATSADLVLADTSQVAADTVRDLIRNGEIRYLLIEEALNPTTGGVAGRDMRKRQLLRLLDSAPGSPLPGAESIHDTLTGQWLVRVRWEDEDKLRFNYCGTIDCDPPAARVTGVSLFRGNLVVARHGRPRIVRFFDPSVTLAGADDFHYEPAATREESGDEGKNLCCTDHQVPSMPGRGVICRLPDARIMYRDTPRGGEIPPQSTLRVFAQEGAQSTEWNERISFVHSGDGPNDDHFVVETDEERLSLVRFGHDGNGRELGAGASVECRYQFGDPLAGNIGADTITQFDRNNVTVYGELTTPAEVLAFQNLVLTATVRNPFDVINGTQPEPAAEIIRNAPEAYRYRQLRAVTLKDYVRRAEEVDGVSRAAAAYAWTGSWRTVRITIDPRGTTELTPGLRARVADYLKSVRLIGEDLEIRPPRYVPLDVQLAVCASPEFWPEDVAFALRDEFSDSFTVDGRPGFFNPDRFTFGQALHASEIIGRAQAVTGVEHVISLTMKRWNDRAAPSDAIVNLRPNEIILVANDPDDQERGFITIDVRGGRR